MQRAIRHYNGSMISPGEWSAIRASARLVKEDLLKLPVPRKAKQEAGGEPVSKTKSHFRRYRHPDWNNALARLEAKEEIGRMLLDELRRDRQIRRSGGRNRGAGTGTGKEGREGVGASGNILKC